AVVGKADIAAPDVPAPDVAAADVTAADVPPPDVPAPDVAAADIAAADVERHRADRVAALRVAVVAADVSARTQLIETHANPLVAFTGERFEHAVEVDVLEADRSVGRNLQPCRIERAVRGPIDRALGGYCIQPDHAAEAIRVIEIGQLVGRQVRTVAVLGRRLHQPRDVAGAFGRIEPHTVRHGSLALIEHRVLKRIFRN